MVRTRLADDLRVETRVRLEAAEEALREPFLARLDTQAMNRIHAIVLAGGSAADQAGRSTRR